jgi:hypothetical protein
LRSPSGVATGRKRLADVHWIDAMYQAYMTAIFGAVALYFLAAAVGDGPLTASQVARVAAEGDDWLWAVVASRWPSACGRAARAARSPSSGRRCARRMSASATSR